MQAAWLENGNLSVRDDLPRPRLEDGEALVRVALAGICATDLEMLAGYQPFCGVPGHEFVGTIAASPSRPQRVGERVVGDINIACRTCPQCRAGRGRHCERRKVLGIRGRDGALADFLRLPLANLLRLPENVPEQAAVFAEPLAAALRVRDQVRIAGGERVLVIGAGRLGQLLARALQGSGCDLLVAARYDRQRQLLSAAGIQWIVPEELPARRFDVVVDASGTPQGCTAALGAVRPEGTVVVKSTFAAPGRIDLAALVTAEITLVGSRCGALGEALAVLAGNAVETETLIEALYPLSLVREAFERASRPGAMKVLVRPGNGETGQDAFGF